MTDISKKIIDEHLVRKTGRQKAAFREALIGELAKAGIEAREEKHKDLLRSVNVVAGDVKTAEMIFTAHYDTCPQMPVPNFITPCRKPLYFLYQMGVVCMMLLAALIVTLPFRGILTEEQAFLVWYILYIGMLFWMLKGPANPKTYNDNTSGVAGLIELMTRTPEDIRKRCAFVFFDNEELGLLGASEFKKLHGERVQKVPLINMDCIGDGETIMLSASQAFRTDRALYDALKTAFGEAGVLYRAAEETVYSSDQKKFDKAMAVAALNKGKYVGYYISRIHTPRDTVLREENIERIAEGLRRTAEGYLKG